MRVKSILPSAIVISLFLLQLTFAALPRYEIIDLGSFGGTYSSAQAINDAGQVVGTSGRLDRAFLWDSSTGMIDLGTLPDQSHSGANGINDRGQVVGKTIGIYEFVAFIWDSEKGMRYLDGIGTRESIAFDINNRGQVVGDVDYAFLWDPDNGVIDIGRLANSGSSWAYAINEVTQVVGASHSVSGPAHAFIWDSINGMRDLGTLGGSVSVALGINNHGQVVGRSRYEPDNDNYRAFLWDNSNGMIDLSSSFVFGIDESVAYAINDAGQIVGYLNPRGPSVAFYLDIEKGMIKLDDLLPLGSMWKELRFAFDINNRGQIVGQGITNSGKTLAFLMTPVPPKIIYVDDDATGTNDGSSWTDAFNYLQDALAAAWSGDEIRVAQGIYKPDQGAVVTTGDRTATFQLINGVTLKGGYAGLGQTDPNARDVELHETILNGDLDGNDIIDVNYPWGLWNEPTRAENSYHVVTGSGTDQTPVLDGFTITAGNANDYWPEEKSRGGGMYNFDCSPTLIKCTFNNNSAFLGAAMINYQSSPTIIDCTFNENESGAGSGMVNEDSSPNVINCTFSGNSAHGTSVSTAGVGGMYNYKSSPTITNCTFSDNFGGEGGMYNDSSNPMITNCTFSGNYSGAIVNHDSSLKLTNCSFIANSAWRQPGGIYNLGSTLILSQCLFSGNLSSGPCGAILTKGYYNHQSHITLTNCTFLGNSGTYGNSLAFDFYSSSPPSTIQLTNSIIWDGENPIWNNDGSTISINYSDVQGGWPGEGNIDSVPLFVDPGYWDANGTPDDANDDVWVDGDYHLLPGSPCIDAGDPNYVAEPNETDLDGKPRIINGRIDMGAYEAPILAEAKILPRTINLASKGKWITAFIWLTDDYDVADIDPDSVFLEDEIQPEQFSVDEQKQVGIATFDREKVQSILNVGDIELTITGRLNDGTVFEGTDIIKVTDKAGKKSTK